jgi:hypothetical protein
MPSVAHYCSLPTGNDQNTDTATPTKQNVTDRELDPTKPQSTGNDKFKTQLSTETLTLVTINIEGAEISSLATLYYFYVHRVPIV